MQVGLGAVIHWIKPKRRTSRPPQNYAHVVIGLLIIILALYQVHLGYQIEWPKTTGRGPVSGIVGAAFWCWVVVWPSGPLFYLTSSEIKFYSFFLCFIRSAWVSCLNNLGRNNRTEKK